MISRQTHFSILYLVIAALVSLIAYFSSDYSVTHPSDLIHVKRPYDRVALCIRVIDGDTIVLEGGEKVRLVGVDAPESKHPRRPVEPYAVEATDCMASLVDGETVGLKFDPENENVGHKDMYRRTLAYVYRQSDGLHANAEIIRQGFARAYLKYDFSKRDEFITLEREAEEHGRGMWQTQPDSGVGLEKKPTRSTQERAPPKVYVTRTGEKYHLASCRYLRQSKISIPLNLAQVRYDPCSVCTPPR